MAVEVVTSEPLSGLFSLLSRENTGKGARKRSLTISYLAETSCLVNVWRSNPYSTEQGIQQTCSGIAEKDLRIAHARTQRRVVFLLPLSNKRPSNSACGAASPHDHLSLGRRSRADRRQRPFDGQAWERWHFSTRARLSAPICERKWMRQSKSNPVDDGGLNRAVLIPLPSESTTGLHILDDHPIFLIMI